MLKVIWLPKAENSLIEISEYIAKDNQLAAYETTLKLYSAAENLIHHTKIGKPGRVHGTRELIVPPSYIIPYRIKNNEIQILNIFHAAREWPEKF